MHANDFKSTENIIHVVLSFIFTIFNTQFGYFKQTFTYSKKYIEFIFAKTQF